MSKTRPQRRLYYVSPRIQGKLIARMATYWCVYHVMLWHAMFVFHYLQQRDAMLAGGPEIAFFDLYLTYAVENSTMLLCAALVFPLILWDMIYLTHRVAGPLVRFQNALRRMAEGEEIRQIQLREGDLLDDLRDAFNDYLDALQERKQGGTNTPGVAASAAAADSAPPSGTRETLQRLPLKPPRNEADEFDSILHDLRDIQSSVASGLESLRSANGRSGDDSDIRID